MAYTKSQGVVLNTTDNTLGDRYRRGLQLEWLQPGQSFRLLGYHLGLGQLDLTPAWNKMLAKAKATLQMLMSQEVSLQGRILLIKSKLFSLIQYSALLHDLPPPVLKQLEEMAWNFLWKKKMGTALAKKKAYRSITAGGLNYPNLQRSIQAQRATLVATLLDPNTTAFWAQVYRAERGQEGA